jgi:hypothetical protein
MANTILTSTKDTFWTTWEYTSTKAVFDYADQTASTTATAGGQGDCGTPMNWFRAYISLKTYTVGTATIGPLFSINVADNAGLSTNLTILNSAYLENVASGTQTQSLVLTGIVPVAARQFCGIKVTFSGTASGTFDARLLAS